MVSVNTVRHVGGGMYIEGVCIMFDIISYIMGKIKGSKNVVIDGDITVEDDGNGNITIEEGNENG